MEQRIARATRAHMLHICFNIILYLSPNTL